MKKIILYFPYKIGDLTSGSGVRPYKMLMSFRKYTKKNRIQLVEIHGESKERKAKVKKIISNIDPKDILFCYYENSTLPYWLTDKDHIPRTPLLELNFFRFLKKNNIPLGLFYRDVYWMFDEEYSLTGFKKIIMKNIYRMELFLYKKYVDYFFLPSIEMNDYVQFPRNQLSNLPPAGDNITNYQNKIIEDGLNLIYVGGISERYGLLEMLEAVSLVNKKNSNVCLHLVCREDEFMRYRTVLGKYNNKPWLKIYHAFGKQLVSIYSRVDIGIIPRQKNTYNDFAVPVKLFEYISYGLPLISTNCNAQANIIQDEELGIVVKDSVEGLIKGITYFLNKDNVIYHREKVRKALATRHQWSHRVEDIAMCLMTNNKKVEKK